MALSMDEQRVLAEIEKRLVAEEPALAACLTSFRRPGPALMLKSPRARILGSLFTVALVAVISLMVYAMIPFRGPHAPRVQTGRSGPLQTSLATSTSRAVTTAAPRSTPGISAGKAKVSNPKGATTARTPTKTTSAKSVMGGTTSIP
jgi:hypothetical protein